MLNPAWLYRLWCNAVRSAAGQPMKPRGRRLGTWQAGAWTSIESLEVRHLLSGIPVINDVDTLLQLRFDGGLAGEGGETPLSNAGVAFTTGLVDEAVHLGDSEQVLYSTAGNIDPKQGTIEFWIKPDWNGNQGESHAFFEVGDNFNNGFLFVIDGANNIRFIQWGDNPETPAIEADVERGVGVSGTSWMAGEWHHLAATWETATRKLVLYMDGKLVASDESAISFDQFSTSALTVGAETGGVTSAKAAFDEFRISSRARTTAEISADYRAGLGLPTLLSDARGVAVDSTSRALLAEAAANRVAIFDSQGTLLSTLGSVGSGVGQFNLPTDVAVNADDDIFVLDAGNSRVQKFDREGNFISSFGSQGSGPGELLNPQGIEVDSASGAIYIADTGNQRVQKFRSDGSLDTGWGVGGIVGTSSTLKRDHTGFDRPTDVAVNPLNGQFTVSDFGNQRLEVFTTEGLYLRSYLAVYRPNALAFDSSGNLYIAGEDPNEGYTAYDGRLRVLKTGDELVSAYYTGGLDDIGRIETGVAVRPDGAIIFVDNINGRLVKTDAAFVNPVSDLQIEAKGTQVTFRWKTARPSSGSVRIGTTSIGDHVVTDPIISMDHEVTVTGLTENTRLFYSVSFPDSFNSSQSWTPSDPINTGSVPGMTQFLRIKAAGVIYTDASSEPGYERIDAATLAEMHARYERLADFYWRNSGFKLWFDIDVIEVDKDISSGSYDLFANMEPDLAALGYSAADDFDAAWGASVLTAGNFGGGGNLFGRFVGMCEWVTQDDFVAIHEVNHTIDSIYDFMGLRKYEFNHGIWAVPGGVGGDFSTNGQILRNLLPANFTATTGPFTKVMTAADLDNDGLPDSSPAGLLHPLSITEVTLGSSSSQADTDGDGLTDLDEAMALPDANTDLNSSDTDGDGIPDGADLNPAYRMTDQINKGTPTIDGVISASEGWTVVTDHWGFTNRSLVFDNNLFQDQVTVYAAWDENALFLALQGPPGQTQLNLDGSADNWFFGPDNYALQFRNDFASTNVSINVGVPDVFRQIDDDGQFSTFLDTDAQFTRPYDGRHFFDHPEEGLGFVGRLVSESDLIYQRGGSGNQSAWEVAIPFSKKTLLTGFAGKEMALELSVEGDRLFSVDHAARLRLVNTANRPPVAEDGVLTTHENTAESGQLVVTDSDTPPTELTISIVSPPQHGQVQITDIHSGAYLYTPAPDYHGPDSFTFRASDGDGFSQIATVLITVLPADRSTTISGVGTGTLNEDQVLITVEGKLIVHDPDPEENVFQLPASLEGTFGSFEFDPLTGEWSYSLDNDRAATNALMANQVVTDSLIVKSLDGQAQSTISVQITGADDSPVITTQILPLLYQISSRKSVSIDSSATLQDVDSPLTDFQNSILKVSGQLAKDKISISLQGALRTQGRKVLFNNVLIGTVTRPAKNQDFSITFNRSATQSQVQATLKSLAFKTSDKKATGSRILKLQIMDIGTQRTNEATRVIQVQL